MFSEAQNFELKSGLIHLLPTFRGLENKDPHKFLKEFHVVCSGLKSHVINEDQIKLREFPFFQLKIQQQNGCMSSHPVRSILR